jgi:dynein heavy chain
MQKNPASLTALLGKLYVFAFTWAFGGNLRRQDDYNDDTAYSGYHENADFDAAADFDSFIRNLFDMPPPFGRRPRLYTPICIP